MTNSQGRHEETSSRATTGSPMTQKLSQTENPTACAGRLAHPVKSWDAGKGWEKKEECDLFCPFNFIQRKSGWEASNYSESSIRWKKLPRIILVWGIFMTSSLHATICLGTEYSENLQFIRNTGQKPIVQKLFDAIDTLIREQELEIWGVSELSCRGGKWEELYLASDKEVFQFTKTRVYVV